MPQLSIYYACGRIGVLRGAEIRRAQLERLISARSYDEAKRALSDIGFAAADDQDFQAAADRHVLKACERIRVLSPEPSVTDCFLLRYDVHNLKVLLKARHLAHKPEFLSQCGALSLDKLRHAVTERAYAALPPELKLTLEALEKKLAAEFDPMPIDTELDKALYRQIFKNLDGCDIPSVKRYFHAKADLQNFIMLERAKAMGRDAAFFAQIALPGGNTPVKEFVKAFGDNDRVTKSLKRYGVTVYQAAVSAALNPHKLPLMEKTADDYLYGLFKPYRYEAVSMEVLIAYLLQLQREATDVRLIMAGKLNNFKPEAVAERMRELNG